MGIDGLREKLTAAIMNLVSVSGEGLFEDDIIKSLKKEFKSAQLDDKQIKRVLERLYNCGYIKRKIVWNHGQNH
jgi:hypothetical protein